MRMMTVKEASSFTRLAVPTLYKYRSLDRIPYIKVGAKLLFEAERLEAWLARQGHEPCEMGAAK